MRDAHLAENIFQTRSSNNFKRRQEIRLISYIKGTVAYKGKDSVVIENHGIGYQIKVPSRVLEGVNSGEEAMLHTYLYVREDQLALFGFSSIQELETFQILLGISGIGPKAALSVLPRCQWKICIMRFLVRMRRVSLRHRVSVPKVRRE